MKVCQSCLFQRVNPVWYRFSGQHSQRAARAIAVVLFSQFFLTSISAASPQQAEPATQIEMTALNQESLEGFDEDFGEVEDNTDEKSKTERDPLESWNRGVFAFNDRLDRWLIKPLAKGYRKVTPKPVKRGFSNVFQNLGTIPTVANDVLQWKWRSAGKDSARFLINSTLGLAGIFDVAEGMGIARSDGEDFGQTLAAWGVPSGPYLVLPFLGASTVRGLAATPVDIASNPSFLINDPATSQALFASNLIVIREGLLDAEKLISGDRYTFMRDAYLQRREFLINDGNITVDEFDADEELEEESLDGFDF